MTQHQNGDDPLLGRLEQVATSVDQVRADLEYQAHKRDVRIRTNRALTIATLAVAVIAIWVGVAGIQAQHDSEAEKTRARIASCLQANVQQRGQIAAEVKHDQVLAAHIAPLPRTSETQKQVEDFLSDSKDTSTLAHPIRDCTAEGVAAYLSGHGGFVSTTVPTK